MRKTIISIGAGEMQFEFISRIRKRGYTVVAFGHGRNSSDAIALCDFFADIDTRNTEAAIQWLDSIKEQNSLCYIGVGSYAGGVAIETLQHITNYYGLPTSVPSALIVGMDKYNQQAMYEHYGLSNIKTYKVKDIIKDMSCIDLNEKYILKPSVGRGSEGIEFIQGKDLITRINSQELQGDDVVQNVIVGREYRMLLMVQNREIKLLAPIMRTSYKDTFFLGRLELNYTDVQKIEDHAKIIIHNLGLNSAIVKYDLLVNETGVNLIEMDVGVGGGYYFKKYISLASGVDIMDMYIDLLIGENIKNISYFNNELIMDYVYNEHITPITYELEECRDELESKLGKVEILVNRFHPESRGKFRSNADFVFTVIHKKNNLSTQEINCILNDNCFKEVDYE